MSKTRRQLVLTEAHLAKLELCIFWCLLLSANSAFSQETQPQAAGGGPDSKEAATAASEDTLRKAAQNPIASLISMPLQNNANFGVEPGGRTQDVLNIQPVIPIGVSKDWNLIIRWITPIIWQPLPAPSPAPEVGKYGFGDMQPSFFFSPKKAGKLIWGAGPVLQLPTATDTYLGQGKLRIGPTFVGLTQPGPWTNGALVNNVWSVAGSGGRPDVNQMTLQYFVNYNLKKGWYLGSQPIITANWEATKWGPLDSSIRRRHWPSHASRNATGEPSARFLRKCCAPGERFAVEYASNVRAVVPEEEINDARSLLCHASLPSRKRMEGLEMNSNYTMDPIIKVDESLCIGCRPEQIVLSKAQ